MKLKKFNFKLPRDEARKKKIMLTSISAITLILIITIASTFAYYQSIENQNPINTSVGEFSSGDVIFAVTLDGISSKKFPKKTDGYIASSVVCDKGAIGEWDAYKWGALTYNLSESGTKCNVDFTSDSSLKNTIILYNGGVSAIEAKGSPALNVVPNATTSGIYATDDEYGTSYYYRGLRTSLSNNIIFAGFQWKIVRINGDGSIRLIYNGTEAQFNSAKTMNTTGVNTQIGESAFNSSNSANRFIGYMYGGGSSYISEHSNNANSGIKAYLDTWYVNNIESKGATITSAIADNLFCNDRQLGRNYPGAPTSDDGWNGTGYGSSYTIYAPFYRHQTNASNPIPTLLCAQKNDRFTVSDATIGNASLTYPIGLITADEVVYGGRGNDQYLVTNQIFWTMSPFTSGNNNVNVYVVAANGGLTNGPVVTRGVRAVLNLKPSAKVIGSGTDFDPFKVISE